VKYACIARLRGEYSVRLMCRLLHVSPAGFYAAQHRPPSARSRADQRLRLAIRTAHAASQRRYGAPKIRRELRDQGLPCGRHRVARLMRLDGLRGTCPRAFRVTTQTDARLPVAANTLNRAFAVPTYQERDRAWAADITYLRTQAGWLYLAVVLDVASRRVVGWCADAQLDTTLVLRALQRALTLRQPPAGLIHHSDRGVQYASAAYQQVLAQHGIICSMSRRGNCWDNAIVESFFATLKKEYAHHQRWPTREAAGRGLVQYIEQWYNHQRRHATLDYRSPVQYEREVLHRVRAS
jgi:putative transposase